jgi:hypothetical protein
MGVSRVRFNLDSSVGRVRVGYWRRIRGGLRLHLCFALSGKSEYLNFSYRSLIYVEFLNTETLVRM